ncbi:uncharacterized protein LOC125075609 [Vanessa atalanta]|uniref:uncharacterized protein LOC125075609 n=1 Tax=Vanessa atalanta TaxID=42275 RepID=UPI001FCDBE45|nr:uncharacterized protein LOC125075609 [Vanessa atalanta]
MVKLTKTNNVKLPTIQLPKFGGRYEDWLEFRDTFVSLIHENQGIVDIQKFHYLRASLEGGAAQVIRSIGFSSCNYKIAWDLLCDRYNNERLLIQNHVQSMFVIEPLKRESALGIRSIIDIFSKNLRSLHTLGESTMHWDTLIIYLMNSKLDPKTSRDWEERKSTLNKITLNDFMSFLKNKADLLETIHINNNINKYKNRNDQIKGLLNTNIYIPKCPLCKNTHKIYNCETFLNQSISDRIESARKLKLCNNCLRPGHRVHKCKSGSCTKCSLKHNTLLHKEIGSSQHVEPPVDKATALSVQMTEPVLLSTAVVYILGSDNQRHDARAVLDSGSQASFMTQRLLHKLNLHCQKTQISVTGINSTITQIFKNN